MCTIMFANCAQERTPLLYSEAILSGGLFGTRTKSVHNYYLRLSSSPTVFWADFSQKVCLIIIAEYTQERTPLLYADAFFFRCQNIQKRCTVCTWRPKNADSTALCSKKCRQYSTFFRIWCYFLRGDAMRKRRNHIPLVYGPAKNASKISKIGFP